MTDIPEDAWSEAKAIARKAVWADGRGMIGRERNYLEDRVARAILADRAAQAERMARLEEALKPFADEFARIKKNHEGFESLLSDDATYVGGKLSLGHLHDAARALSQEGSDA